MTDQTMAVVGKLIYVAAVKLLEHALYYFNGCFKINFLYDPSHFLEAAPKDTDKNLYCFLLRWYLKNKYKYHGPET